LCNGKDLLPTSAAHALGEKPQHVHLVRCSVRELWGDQAIP
jgi:hypothetical protein